MRDLAALLFSGLGLASMGYGLLNKQMRFRDGKPIKSGWPSVLARTWFVLIGAVLITLAIYAAVHAD